MYNPSKISTQKGLGVLAQDSSVQITYNYYLLLNENLILERDLQNQVNTLYEIVSYDNFFMSF